MSLLERVWSVLQVKSMDRPRGGSEIVVGSFSSVYMRRMADTWLKWWWLLCARVNSVSGDDPRSVGGQRDLSSVRHGRKRRARLSTCN